MDIIAIERKTYEKMINDFEKLFSETLLITEKYKNVLHKKEWLDNHDVCVMLGISKRTLQTYKEQGLLPYSKLCRKNYFKKSDVVKLLKNHIRQ